MKPNGPKNGAVTTNESWQIECQTSAIAALYVNIDDYHFPRIYFSQLL